MRIEQIIAAVARTVVKATVREIEAARSFGPACLHLWLQRMPLGMSSGYPRSLFSSLDLPSDVDRTVHGTPGNKRGRLQLQPMLALASCPAGTVKA